MIIIFIAILGALAAFLFAISLIPSKSPLKVALEQLEARPGLGKQDSSKIRKFEKIFSKESRGRLARKLVEAGWYTITPAQMGARVVGSACAGLVFCVALLQYIHASIMLTVIVSIMAAGCAAYMPMSMLQRAIEKRKTAVQKTLPDLLDMVATTVQAGLSINAALGYAIEAAPGALGEEIKEALAEIRLGRARAEALKAAAQRLQHQGFTTTVTAITQAERLGSNISRVLLELAEDVRNQRIMLVEEKAAKLPVKMVFPMALFLLPALFVIIFGALAANYFTQQQ